MISSLPRVFRLNRGFSVCISIPRWNVGRTQWRSRGRGCWTKYTRLHPSLFRCTVCFSCLRSTSLHLYRDAHATDILHALRGSSNTCAEKVPSLSRSISHGSGSPTVFCTISQCILRTGASTLCSAVQVCTQSCGMGFTTPASFSVRFCTWSSGLSYHEFHGVFSNLRSGNVDCLLL